MKCLSRIGLVIVLVVSGCKDFRTESGQTPLEASSDGASLSTEVDARTPTSVEGTVCSSYRKHLSRYRMALARTPDDTDLLHQVATFETLIEDACG